MKRTKIVCTIGPASDKKAILKKMINAGMNVARLNFSHNVHSYHLGVIKTVRALAEESGEPIAILQDLQGPRIRLGNLPEAGVNLKNKSRVVLTTEAKIDSKKIPVTYDRLHLDVKAGERILIADGLIELSVKSVHDRDVVCYVVNGGKVFSHKGINLPDTSVRVPALSDKDKEDLLFGVKNKVDFVALSFVRSAREVHDLRDLIRKYEKKLGLKETRPIKIIVKIERREAIDNLESILASADGVMVARGDLGIELPAEEVPLIQKMLIDKCLHAAKPVIVATQMLDSMINNPRPTRAEVSDVANAVIDHADAVMLSGETASGSYPIEAVSTMARIVESTENSSYDDLVAYEKLSQIEPASEAIAGVAKILSMRLGAKAILVASLSGHSARIVSRYRPELPIFAACNDGRVQRQLNLSWGVRPFILPLAKDFAGLVQRAEDYLKKRKDVKKNDQMVVVAGVPLGASGGANIAEIKEVV